jgi:DNA-binding MarR family transcriptional regulator
VQATKRREAVLADLATGLRDVLLGMRRNVGGTEHEKAAVVLLSHLLSVGPVRASDLAERACLDPSTVSRHLKSLEAAGYLTRTPDPGDGRATVLGVSAAGQRLVDDARVQRIALLRSALAGWTAADVATLTALVRRLADDLEMP